MHPSVLLALASALLTHALPTGPNLNPTELHPRAQWVPNLPYPSGYTAASCPANPNPWGAPSKRAIQTSALCQQVASINYNNVYQQNLILTPPPVHLNASGTYAVAWGLNQYVTHVTVWQNLPDGTSTQLQAQGFNSGVGMMTMNYGPAMDVHFDIVLYDDDELINGEVAVYLTANGNTNPDPGPSPPGGTPGKHD